MRSLRPYAILLLAGGLGLTGTGAARGATLVLAEATAFEADLGLVALGGPTFSADLRVRSAPDTPSVFFRAERATITLVETRYASETPDAAPVATTASFAATSLRVYLEQAGDGSWRATGSAAAASNASMESATCRLTRDPALAMRVAGACDAQTFQATNLTSLDLGTGWVRLLGNGLDRDVRAGELEVPSATLPAPAKDRVLRKILIEPASASQLTMPWKVRAITSSATLEVTGTLMPETGSPGQAKSPLRGSFHVAPTGGDRIAIAIARDPDAPQAPGSADRMRLMIAIGIPTVALAGVAWKFVLPLFTRLAPDDLLAHPRRRNIHDLIRADPGISLKEVRDQLELGQGTVAHHVRVLAQQGRIVVRKMGRRRGLFVTGAVTPAEQALLISMRHPAAAQVLDALTQNPQATQHELAAAVGLSQQYVSKVLRFLERNGAIERDAKGARVRRTPLVAPLKFGRGTTTD